MKLLFLIIFILGSVTSILAQDVIIFRDGHIKNVKIIQTSNDKTLFKDTEDEYATEESVDNKKIFMLKFKTRGNVVFNSKGERISSTYGATKIPRGAIAIYYNDGRELFAYKLTVDTRVVTYYTNKKGEGTPITAPKSEIFMIRYPDGTRDVLTNIADYESQQLQLQKAADEAKLKAEIEKRRADSINASMDEPTTLSAPQKATIVTTRGVKMKVWICDDNGTTVTYKRTNSEKAAIFRMSKSKIKSISYNNLF